MRVSITGGDYAPGTGSIGGAWLDDKVDYRKVDIVSVEKIEKSLGRAADHFERLSSSAAMAVTSFKAFGASWKKRELRYKVVNDGLPSRIRRMSARRRKIAIAKEYLPTCHRQCHLIWVDNKEGIKG